MRALSLLFLINFIWISGHCASDLDTNRIRQELEAIVRTEAPRNHKNPEVLDSVSAYIAKQMKARGGRVRFQEFQVRGETYRNVIASFGPDTGARTIVGAHYDVAEGTPGADDNASGVVGLLELARILKGESLDHRIDLVAYTLEEPPFFGTKEMGSYRHARFLAKNSIPVRGMICLEMLGYFRDEKGSQEYPLGILKLIYGRKGDFITLVERFRTPPFCKRFRKSFKDSCSVETKVFQGPRSLKGVDFSDHRNYWEFGIPALMITDTAFYRNPHYHRASDRIGTLDLERMARVIEGIGKVLLQPPSSS